MSNWNELNQGRQALTADNHLARFIGRRYLPLSNWDFRVLDIGPGKHGANQTYLENLGMHVFSVDIADVRANFHGDITRCGFLPESFNAILDINTLCHVKGMDYSKFTQWLRPNGRMFSIMPMYDTWRGHLEGKGYVWCPSRHELDAIFGENFSRVDIDKASYTFEGNTYTSWLIEAQK